MAREYLRVTPETTPGTYNSAGTAVIIDIDHANAYTLRPQVQRQSIRTAGTLNRRAGVVGKKTSFTGNLAWSVRGSQTALLVDWCFPVSGVLKSYTVDHVIVGEDAASTPIYDRTLGVFVQQAQFQASEQDQWFKAALQLVGLNKATITATDFPEPASTAYPSDAFLTFEDATGGLTIHGVARLDFETFDLTAKNMLDIRYFVGVTPQKIKYCGRDVDLSARLSLSSAIPRADYEAQTPVDATITFNNGTHGLTFACHAKNYYSKVTDALDISKVYLQEISLESHVDPAVGDELTVTAS